MAEIAGVDTDGRKRKGGQRRGVSRCRGGRRVEFYGFHMKGTRVAFHRCVPRRPLTAIKAATVQCPLLQFQSIWRRDEY